VKRLDCLVRQHVNHEGLYLQKECGGVDVVTSVITDGDSLALLLNKRHFYANE